MNHGLASYSSTFKISGMIIFGPLDENEATTGAEESLIDSLFNMFA